MIQPDGSIFLVRTGRHCSCRFPNREFLPVLRYVKKWIPSLQALPADLCREPWKGCFFEDPNLFGAGTWTCSRCTLENPVSKRQCDACLNRRSPQISVKKLGEYGDLPMVPPPPDYEDLCGNCGTVEVGWASDGAFFCEACWSDWWMAQAVGNRFFWSNRSRRFRMYWILQVDGCWYQHMCCLVRVLMRFRSRRREVDGLWRVNVVTNWQVDSWNLNWSLWNFQQMNEQCTDVQAFVGKDLWKLLFPFTLLGTNMELFSPEKSILSRWFSKLPGLVGYVIHSSNLT